VVPAVAGSNPVGHPTQNLASPGETEEKSLGSHLNNQGLEWPKIIWAIATVWKEPWEVISAQRGNGALGLAYYLGQRQAGITLRELGRHVGQVQYPAVSIAIARFEKPIVPWRKG
jgi:hypothetical protein